MASAFTDSLLTMNEEYKKDEPEEKAPESQEDLETLLPPDEDEIEQGNETETVSPPEEENEEEIIFPKKDEKESVRERRRPGFSIFNLFALSLVIAGVYLLGYVTNPEKFDETVGYIKETVSLAMKKVGPLEEKLTEFIEATVKKKPEEVGSASSKAEPGRMIAYWQSPMNPSYIRDQPGKSPMGMDLIPVYEDEIEEQEIRISPTITQNIGVKTEIIKIRNLSRTIRTIGRLTYDERKVTHIHTKYEGWIEKLHVDFTGQKVAKGDLLMEIYSPELVSTQEELLLALKYSEAFKDNPFPEISLGADRLLESTKRKLTLLDVPQHQIETLIKDRKITKTMHIHSPVKGFVINKPAFQGMHIKPGMSLYTIADLSNIWVLADIYEYELPWVKIGQSVVMELPYYPGKKFRGTITYIDPFLEAKTRTIKLRMEFENKDLDLKPEMYSNVMLESVIVKNAVAAPEAGIIRSGTRDIVILRTVSGGFESREVTLGAAADGYYQILKGLKGGEEIVISSNFLLDSESKLREGIQKLEEDKDKTAPDMKSMPGMKNMPEMKSLPKMKELSGMENMPDGMLMEGRKTIILKEDQAPR